MTEPQRPESGPAMRSVEARDLYRDEVAGLVRLTSSAPPLVSNVEVRVRDGRTIYEVIVWEEPADAIGQSMSAALLALVGGIRADFISYGPRHPIRRAMAEWDRQCRRRHRLPTWNDHAVPICGDMLRAVVEGGASVRWCAEHWGLSYPRAERLVVLGLNYVGEQYARALDIP